MHMDHDPAEFGIMKRWILEHGMTDYEYIEENIEDCIATGEFTDEQVDELRRDLRKQMERVSKKSA